MTITIEVSKGGTDWNTKTLTLEDVDGQRLEDVLALIAMFLGGAE